MDTSNEEWKDAAAEGSASQNVHSEEKSKDSYSDSPQTGYRRPRIPREESGYTGYRKPYSGYRNSYGQGERRTYYNNNNYNRYNNSNQASSESSENGEERSYRPRPYNNYNRSERPYRPRYNAEGNSDEQRPWQQSSYAGRNENGYRQGGGYDRNRTPRPYGNRSYGNRPYNPNYKGTDENNTHNPEERPAYGDRPAYGNQSSYRPQNRNYGYNRYGNEGGYRQGGYGRPNNGYGRPGGYNRNNRPGFNPNVNYSQKKQIEYKEYNVDPNAPIRLNKFLANAGICSRREADEFIQAGVVSVNGSVVTELGMKVLRTDEVKFHDQPVTMERKTYVLLNKPKDCVTTVDDPQERKTVMDLVKGACQERIYPVGRLDRNTTGVLLLTNDGELASKLTHPQFLKKKVYQVTLDRTVSKEDLDKIATGITLEDGEIQADAIGYSNEEDRRQVGIEIHSGKNRIVRRIFESLGYRVIKLDRVLFAGLTKKNLRRGDWRFLTEAEVNMLRMGAFE